jgi:hypothetical protein
VHGATQLSRPAPEALTAWLDDYSLGDLWLKNLLGGRPQPGLEALRAVCPHIDD